MATTDSSPTQTRIVCPLTIAPMTGSEPSSGMSSLARPSMAGS